MNFLKPIIFSLIGLFIIVIGLYFDKTTGNDSAILASEISRNLSKQIRAAEQEASKLLRNDSLAWKKAKHSFFLMDTARVLRWNKNDFLPDVRTVQDDFVMRLLRWPRGLFLLRKWSAKDGKFLLSVIHLQDRYKINNRYLVSGWNKEIFPTQDITINEAGGTGYPFIWNGKILFTIELTNASQQRTGVNWSLFTIMAAGILFLLVGLYILANRLHRQGRYEVAFFSLLTLLVGGRILMLVFFLSPDLALFDPAFFASSSYNRSVGDLFLNTICLTTPIAYLFYNFFRFNISKKILALEKGLRGILSILLLLLCFFSILFPFLFFETIFHNSTISLDITQTLNFNSIRIFSFISIIIGCASGFMLVHLFISLASSLVGNKRLMYFLHLGVAAIIFLLFSFLIQRNYLITFFIGTLYLSVIYALNLSKFLRRTSYASFLYFFVAIVAFATQGSFSIKKFSIEDKVNSQFRFANAFLTDRDYLGEYLLGESVQRISSDPFIQTRLGSPFLSKTVVRQKVKQVYLNSYFDRYDIKIHLFNSSGDSYDNSTTLGFAKLITNFQQEANKTSYEGVYFLKNSTPESTKQYLVVIPINRFGMISGYIVLDLSLKRIIPRNVFPELLLDDRFIQYFKNRDFSYAFYVDNHVSSSFGDFNFEKKFSTTWLSDSKLYKEGIYENSTIHIGVEDELGNVTVVSSPLYPSINIVINFSFLFTIGLNMILVGLLIYGAITLYQRRELNYSARIQLYVYLAFILPLFLVSVTTLGLISKSAERELKEEFVEKSKLLGERLTPQIDVFLGDINAASNELDNQLIELAKLANVDASVFSPSGKLLTSSQPLIYEDRILSSLIDRNAYEIIVNENEQSFVNNEQIGSLSYNSSYYALKSPESGKLIGILSLPFFESAYSLEKTRINVVANIITIFCIVFMLFSVLSYFAVRWLTFPLQFITKTLRRTTLTGVNKPLVWNSHDEIGLMVDEYNKMVENLEQSRVDLSRIQKESAWREIAKQVAHEVKNPLTPMKLTLQQMEQALLSGNLSKEKTEKSVQTLLQQVEILNDIAASFSAFARMPAPILQKIELTSLVKRVVDLHTDYKEGTVALKLPEGLVYVMGDDQLLSRVFSNIILNALQARDDGRKIIVEVNVALLNSTCIITFIDNGNGIDADLREKVFQPHFSTKKSGSGLGLAIAKQGIEQNGGRISFKTQLGKGTTFLIEIPTVTT